MEKFAKLIPILLLAAFIFGACGSGNHYNTRGSATVTPATIADSDGKAASTPPTGTASRIPDLALTDNGDGTLHLQWHYYNAGDYNQDGTTNVADITSIAMHYNHDPGTDEMDIIIHPSGVGKVSIADVTPIAMGFNCQVAGYEVQYAASADATTWSDLAQVPFAMATGTGRLLFATDVASSGAGYYAVTPYDASDARGIRSVPAGYLVPAPGWEITTVDNVNDVGTYPSLVIVDGNPAIAYLDRLNYDLMYVRATAADGSAWGTPVRVDYAGAVGPGCSLAVISGYPAISYIESNLQKLKYVRATDIDGNTWGTPIVVTDGFYEQTTLLSVGGYASIAYRYDYHPYFVRATAPEGGAWGTPTLVDGTETNGLGPAVAMVEGAPAIVHQDGITSTIMYVRDGSVGDYWPVGTPVAAPSAYPPSNNLIVSDGNPALSFVDGTHALCYMSAADSYGASWNPSVTLDNTRTVDAYSSMTLIGGVPAIAYNAFPTGLYYVQSYDAEGIAWRAPATIDASNAAWGCSLAEVSGQPAIAFYDSVNMCLKYARYVP